MKLIWLASTFLLVIGCGTAGATQSPSKTERTAPNAKATRVEVAKVTPSEPKLELTLPGEVEGQRDAQLGAPRGGYIESVHVKVGDQVRAGQLLVRVDSSTQTAVLDQAKVELYTASREYQRARALGDAIPSAEVDAAESRWQAAKASFGSQAVAVSRSVVTAPFAGVVVEVDAEVGEVAAAQPLVRVVQIDPAKVTVSVSDRDIVALREGQEARVTTDALTQGFTGKVKRIRKAADLSTRTFTAEVEVANPGRQLLPGMIASVSLSTELDGNGLVISQDWLVTRGDDVGVFVEQAGVAKWRTVTLGPLVRHQIVVMTGLAPGENLITTGHRDLADGDPLLITRKGSCCTLGRVVFD
ncbi:MAG: efflux RND transporter periplasmic adaptor subunit [Polyangiaceae bacterium]|nr:efflux RND transporter periplasmic adaptor subunit [Polyangiaceae bacterium]